MRMIQHNRWVHNLGHELSAERRAAHHRCHIGGATFGTPVSLKALIDTPPKLASEEESVLKKIAPYKFWKHFQGVLIFLLKFPAVFGRHIPWQL